MILAASSKAETVIGTLLSRANVKHCGQYQTRADGLSALADQVQGSEGIVEPANLI